jgi:Rieske Fe-S protein
VFGRRKLLIVGGGALFAACGPQFGGLPAQIAAGTAAGLAVNTLQPVAGLAVAIGRDSRGVYALSLYCTHAGCDTSVDGSVSESGIDCFCHNSLFDSQGNVVRGPANSPLSHFVVTDDAQGNLTIHTDQPTASSTRLLA